MILKSVFLTSVPYWWWQGHPALLYSRLAGPSTIRLCWKVVSNLTEFIF